MDQLFRTTPDLKSVLLYVGSFPLAFIPLIIIPTLFPSLNTMMFEARPYISMTQFLVGYWMLFLWLISWCGLWHLKLPQTLFQEKKQSNIFFLWIGWLLLLTLVSYLLPLFPPPLP